PLAPLVPPPAATEPYTLSLHDALPISAMLAESPTVTTSDAPPCAAMSSARSSGLAVLGNVTAPTPRSCTRCRPGAWPSANAGTRSEEHTSELQSRENLVCRLLLEKKKK